MVKPRRRQGRESLSPNKSLQLCSEVQRVLSLVLPESRDELIARLGVEAVRPLPGGFRLLVEVIELVDEDEAPTPRDEVIERLNRARSFLRMRVAEFVQRRKAPELVFELWVPSSDEGVG